MTYIEYLNQFHRWRENSNPGDKVIVLYLNLLDMFNQRYWPEWVGVTTQQLMILAHTDRRQTAFDARDALVRAGFIEYRPGRKNKPTVYRLLALGNEFETENRTENRPILAKGELVVIPGKDTRMLTDAMFELNAPIYGNPYPFRFRPTFRRYLLDELRESRTAKDIFVCSMADLFGDWVPTRWIRDVLDACSAAPKHRYLFLTKNPARYDQLNQLALLPREENFWYGATVTQTADFARWPIWLWHNEFLSVEPLLGRVELSKAHIISPKWVIIGAETGNYRPVNKVTPERVWVDEIAVFCEKRGIPVFYKDSLRKLFPDLPPSAYPW